MAERVQRADLRERLEDFPVDEPEVDPGTEVGEGLERPVLLARGDDRFDRALTDVLHREQPEPDGRTLDGELNVALVDVGRQDLDPHSAALRDRSGDLLLVRAEGGQDRGHVLDRVVRLQIGGLVRDQPVAGRVRLVEPVPLERLERLEHRVDDLRLDTPLRGLGDELLLLRPEHRRLLLADRVAEGVGLGTGEAAEGDGGGHDVLLVDEDPVGLLQVRLEQRMEIGDWFLAVLPADVGRDVVHRPGAEERDHRCQVVYRARLRLPDVAAHPRRLELEDSARLARREQVERLRVVERNVVEVELDPALLPDQVDGVAQDRQVGEAEEVELEESERLDAVHLVLGHQRVGVGRPLERHQLGQRLAGDDDARGVRGRIPGDALEL